MRTCRNSTCWKPCQLAGTTQCSKHLEVVHLTASWHGFQHVLFLHVRISSQLVCSLVHDHPLDGLLASSMCCVSLQVYTTFLPMHMPTGSTFCVKMYVARLAACSFRAGARALALIDEFKEQELSNVVWAFAKLQHYKQGLFAQLLATVKAKLPHFLPQVSMSAVQGGAGCVLRCV
eukprot:GHRQ01028324.1.p2 GENE.GHRQ01028324.1~~GHRQ01028324.1.p2  ORF type:complete len:176 (+),score=37.47 GHRQ01028324.1:349-876(+)